MRTRRQNYSADRLTITGPNMRLKDSTDEGENSEPIPTDLVIEVLSRLPLKSVARIRCVSKRWASILFRPYFSELFLTRSSAFPKLLFACEKEGKLLQIFSSPQPQNPDENLSVVTANYHMSFPFDDSSSKVIRAVNGLICLQHLRISGKNKDIVVEICNPSTGQSFTSPKLKTRRIRGNSFLGYEPIEKQFKLLSTTRTENSCCSLEHQVLTLGTKKLSWRKIECSTRHRLRHNSLSDSICIRDNSLSDSICIDGCVLYPSLACFDMKSEKFEFIKVSNIWEVKLVNYKGKLAILQSDKQFETGTIIGASKSFKLGVLVDFEKNEWSYHTYEYPSLWKDMVGDDVLSFVGVTRTDEIVFSPNHTSNGFYLIYCNIERNTFTKVEIQGIDASSRYYEVYTFLDHVEDVQRWGSV